MSTTESFQFVNEVTEKEAQEVFQLLGSSLIFHSATNTKAELLDIYICVSLFSTALENVMKTKVVKSKQDRLKVIRFMDKLNQQKDKLEIAQRNLTDLQIAADRLGRKAQSAFSPTKFRKKQTL